MASLAAAQRPSRKSIFLAAPLAIAVCAPAFAQDTAAPAAPAATNQATPVQPVEAAAKPTPPDAAKLITPQVVAEVKKLVLQPVTVISIGASNDAHAAIDQAGIDKLDGEWKVGAGQVFVCGDNRDNSLDSRTFGPIDTKDIVGTAAFRFLPIKQTRTF